MRGDSQDSNLKTKRVKKEGKGGASKKGENKMNQEHFSMFPSLTRKGTRRDGKERLG